MRCRDNKLQGRVVQRVKVTIDGHSCDHLFYFEIVLPKPHASLTHSKKFAIEKARSASTFGAFTNLVLCKEVVYDSGHAALEQFDKSSV